MLTLIVLNVQLLKALWKNYHYKGLLFREEYFTTLR